MSRKKTSLHHCKLFVSNRLAIILCLVAFVSCTEDDQSIIALNVAYCERFDIETNDLFDNVEGRVYQFPETGEPLYYFIGDADQWVNGGYVPCNLPEIYLPNDRLNPLVKFSGIWKDSSKDDPLYLGVELTSIEFLTENTD